MIIIIIIIIIKNFSPDRKKFGFKLEIFFCFYISKIKKKYHNPKTI
jgi:hypothetical protein